MIPISTEHLKDPHYLALVNICSELGIEYHKRGLTMGKAELESCIISAICLLKNERKTLKKDLARTRQALDDDRQRKLKI